MESSVIPLLFLSYFFIHISLQVLIVFNFQTNLCFIFIFTFLLFLLNDAYLITASVICVFFCLNWMTLALQISIMIENSISFQGPLFLKCLLRWIFKQAKLLNSSKEKNNQSIYLFNNFSYERNSWLYENKLQDPLNYIPLKLG